MEKCKIVSLKMIQSTKASACGLQLLGRKKESDLSRIARGLLTVIIENGLLLII